MKTRTAQNEYTLKPFYKTPPTRNPTALAEAMARVVRRENENHPYDVFLHNGKVLCQYHHDWVEWNIRCEAMRHDKDVVTGDEPMLPDAVVAFGVALRDNRHPMELTHVNVLNAIARYAVRTMADHWEYRP